MATIKLKSIVDEELERAKIRVGMKFLDSRDTEFFVRELVDVFRTGKMIYYIDQKGGRWTPNFIEEEIKEDGYLTIVK